MVSPLDADWNNNLLSDENLNKTTLGSGSSFPSTWRTDRLFFRTDEKKLYKNTGTQASPTWQEMGASGVNAEATVMKYSTTPSDYSYPTTATALTTGEATIEQSSGNSTSYAKNGTPSCNRIATGQRFLAGSELLGSQLVKVAIYSRLTATNYGTNAYYVSVTKDQNEYNNTNGTNYTYYGNNTTPTASTSFQYLESPDFSSNNFIIEEGDRIQLGNTQTSGTQSELKYNSSSQRDNEKMWKDFFPHCDADTTFANASSSNYNDGDIRAKYTVKYSPLGATMTGGKYQSTSGASNYLRYDMGSTKQLSAIMINPHTNNTAEKFEVQVADSVDGEILTHDTIDSTISDNGAGNFYYGNESHRYRKLGVTVSSSSDIIGKKLKKVQIHGSRNSGSGSMVMVLEGAGGEVEQSTNVVTGSSFSQSAQWHTSDSTTFLFDGKKKVSAGDKLYIYGYSWSSGCCDDMRFSSTSNTSLGSGIKQDIGDLGSTTWDSTGTPAWRIYTEGSEVGTFQTVRTINASQLTTGQNNFVRFNPRPAQFLQIIDKTDGQSSTTSTDGDYSEDFTSDNWTNGNGSNVFVDTSNTRLNWDCGSGTSSSHEYFDLQDSSALGSGNNASDTQWILRFKMTVASHSNSSSSSCHAGIGLSSTTGSYSDTQDSISFVCGAGTSSHDQKFYSHYGNNNTFLDSNNREALSETPSSNDVFWVDLRRTSATDFQVSLYSDSSFSTLVEQQTRSNLSSNTTDLRYIKFATRSQNVNTNNGYIEDIEFYNDTDTPSTTTVVNPKVLSVTEMKVMAHTDDEALKAHGHITNAISTTDTTISLSGE